MTHEIDTDWSQKLVEANLLGPDSLDRARHLAKQSGEPVSAALTRLGLVSEEDLAATFSGALDLPRVASDALRREPLAWPGMSPDFLRHTRVLPLSPGDAGDASAPITLAMADPTDEDAVEAVALYTRRAVARAVALPTDLEAAIDRLYPQAPDRAGAESAGVTANASDLDRLRESASDAPVIRLVNALLGRAVDERGSDLHIEPTADGLAVRLRVDGQLQDLGAAVPPRLRDAVVSRVKLMAGLDIAERRLPQDGRLAHAVRGQEVDFRVATTPTVHGESVVVRVLDRAQVRLDFASLGFDAPAMAALKPLLAAPHGLLLVTGPTGSGKTTTLYAALAALNAPERKLMTIEDPIEYQLDGVQQVQVQPAIGLTFARALRSFLRHNPNIVMVGEIRDLETAQIAVQVALTGHLVLSTLHTNDAATGVTRLLDMGVEDYLIASTCNAIMAQRLVRTLCSDCRAPHTVAPAHARGLGFACDEPVTLFRATGCTRCSGTGYRGRTTIAEILPFSPAIRDLVLRRASAAEVGEAAVAEGMRTMHMHGLEKARAGLTTVEDVLLATRAG